MNKINKRIILSVLCIVVVVILFGFYRYNSDVILVVNGEKIENEEYEFLASCSMPYLDTYSNQTYDLQTNKVLLIRAEQILLKENGIIKTYEYAQFLEQQKDENEKRKKALESNQIIYGPKQYDKKVYFDYYYSECRNRFMNTIRMDTSKQNNNRDDLNKVYADLLQKKAKELSVVKK